MRLKKEFIEKISKKIIESLLKKNLIIFFEIFSIKSFLSLIGQLENKYF